MVSTSTWGATVATVESSIASVSNELDTLIEISIDFDKNLGHLKEESTKKLQKELQLINDWKTNLPNYQQYIDAFYKGKRDLSTLENFPKEFLNFHQIDISSSL